MEEAQVQPDLARPNLPGYEHTMQEQQQPMEEQQPMREQQPIREQQQPMREQHQPMREQPQPKRAQHKPRREQQHIAGAQLKMTLPSTSKEEQ